MISRLDERVLTGTIGARPSSPPKSTQSPTPLPTAGISRTAVVFLLIMPIAASSAMIAAIVSAGVSPGMAIMSRPTEQTAVIASSLSMVMKPRSRGFDHARVFRQRDEGAGQSADIARRHGAAFLHGVVEQRRARRRAMRADAVEPDLLQDPRDAVAFGRRRRQREIDDAERHAQPRRGCSADQFAGAGDLERRASDDRGQRAEIGVARAPGSRCSTTPGPLTPTLTVHSGSLVP